MFIKKLYACGMLSLSSLLFVACGDSNDSKNNASSAIDIIDESKMELENGDVLTCNDEREGVVAAVIGGGFRRCEDGAWVKISRAEALSADEILGMGNSDVPSSKDEKSSSSWTPSSSSIDASSSSSWSLEEAIGSTEKSSSSEEIGSTDFVVARENDMPVCSAKREGKTIYVEELDETFICSDFEWVKEGAASSSSTDPDPKPELYKCPNGQYAETREECPSSSSSLAPTEDPGSTPAVVKPDGYYSNSENCPAGLVCKYATTTEYLNSSKTYGEILDTRDGQVYKTITIGTQTWMAQNLNYRYVGVKYNNFDGDVSDSTSLCYDNEPDKCAIYGRLYTWAAAMDSAGIVDPTGAGKGCGNGVYCEIASASTLVRGACPAGWHLPSNDEWNALYEAVGGTNVGKILMAKSDFWNNNDDYGFSILPSGGSCFWSSTEMEGNNLGTWIHDFYGGELSVYAFGGNKERWNSVRCLKDSPDQGGEISSSSSNVTSSSSGTKQSSGSVSDVSSSSSTPIEDLNSKPAWQYLNPDIDYGTMTDTRDGQVYKTVEICDKDNKNCQTWMAENLNYAYEGVKFNYSGYASDSTSWCYDNDPDNCAIYGRLYTWSAAMDSAGVVDPSGAGKGCGYGVHCEVASSGSIVLVRGVCPVDWHLPSDGEWGTLYANLGGTNNVNQMLKANTSLWSTNTGSDIYGFSVLPAGRRGGGGAFDFQGHDYIGRNSFFWSSTEYGDGGDYPSGTGALGQSFDIGYGEWLGYKGESWLGYKNNGVSVRCLKD